MASRKVSQSQVWEEQKRKHKFRLNSGAGGIMAADGTIASDYVSQGIDGGYAFKPLSHQEEGEVRGWLHRLGFKTPLDGTVGNDETTADNSLPSPARNSHHCP